MTPPPAETPSLPLDPATLDAIQCATIDALPPRPGASTAEIQAQHEGALAFLAALRPRDLMQATLATRIVATHHAAMECFRRAARDNLPANLHARVVGKAVALCRLMDAAMRDLGQRQASVVPQPAALPATVPAAHAQPAPEAAPAGAGTPAQPPAAEGRHERRRRERAERHLAAAMQRAGLGMDARATAMQQRLLAEAEARAAAPAPALAA